MTDILLQDLSEKMNAAITHLTNNLLSIRGSRPSTEPIEKLNVISYGAPTHIKNIASVSLGNKCINVDVYDIKQVNIVDSAIKNSDLGFSTKTDGKSIQVYFSEFDEDKNEKIKKIITNSGQDTKIRIKNIREEYINIIKKQKKNKEISEDEQRKSHNQIQKETDNYNLKINNLIKAKIQNLNN